MSLCICVVFYSYMEQNSRLKPATKHVIRCAAALACPKMAPTFLIGQTLNNVSAYPRLCAGVVAGDRSIDRDAFRLVARLFI